MLLRAIGCEFESNCLEAKTLINESFLQPELLK